MEWSQLVVVALSSAICPCLTCHQLWEGAAIPGITELHSDAGCDSSRLEAAKQRWLGAGASNPRIDTLAGPGVKTSPNSFHQSHSPRLVVGACFHPVQVNARSYWSAKGVAPVPQSLVVASFKTFIHQRAHQTAAQVMDLQPHRAGCGHIVFNGRARVEEPSGRRCDDNPLKLL